MEKKSKGKEENEEKKILHDMIDKLISFECTQVYEAAKKGHIFVGKDPNDEQYRIIDGPGLDVFGEPLTKKKQYTCVCPNCDRNLAASRLAPHLEKCMGMGRLSFRHTKTKDSQ